MAVLSHSTRQIVLFKIGKDPGIVNSMDSSNFVGRSILVKNISTRKNYGGSAVVANTSVGAEMGSGYL
jgi:hypothetical protein